MVLGWDCTRMRQSHLSSPQFFHMLSNRSLILFSMTKMGVLCLLATGSKEPKAYCFKTSSLKAENLDSKMGH